MLPEYNGWPNKPTWAAFTHYTDSFPSGEEFAEDFGPLRNSSRNAQVNAVAMLISWFYENNDGFAQDIDTFSHAFGVTSTWTLAHIDTEKLLDSFMEFAYND